METTIEFLMECNHRYKIKFSTFDYLRSVASREKKSFRDKAFCFKCNKPKSTNKYFQFGE